MPFGKQEDSGGKLIDFNLVYTSFILPAVKAAGMEAMRADEETVNGIIHTSVYERLILCDYVIVDLTTAHADVFYKLGIRHAVNPYTTVPIHVAGPKPPFEANGIQAMPYTYDKRKKLTNLEKDTAALTKKLKQAMKRKDTDRPIYQLVNGISFQNSVAHQKTDIFRDQVEYNPKLKKLLDKTRRKKADKAVILQKIDDIVTTLIDIDHEEAGVLIDIMLSYRSLGAYEKMKIFIDSMPTHIKNTVMVREQLGFTLNRLKERDEAIKVLEAVIQQNGASSETYGILGRVHKDQYDETKNGAHLDKAIETYQKGFEADWRDAYPGVNLLTLLAIKGDNVQIEKLATVVAYAVERKIAAKGADYWDYATLLEIAVIADDAPGVRKWLPKTITAAVEGPWMLETTIKNLGLLIKTRKGKTTLAQKALKALQDELATAQ